MLSILIYLLFCICFVYGHGKIVTVNKLHYCRWFFNVVKQQIYEIMTKLKWLQHELDFSG